MNGYTNITHVIPRLQSEFDWSHSFIRELYFCSPNCFQEYRDESGESRFVGGPGPVNIRMIVAAAGSPTTFGIEFLCFDVKTFSLQRLDELAFDCKCEMGSIRLGLGNASINAEDCWIISKEVQVAFLGKDYLGPWLRLGFEFPHEDAIGATTIDEYWRQCTNCSNAWRENPEVSYSRCPECGQLTNLQS